MIYLYLFGTCFHFIYVFMIIDKYNKQYSPIEYIQFSKAVHDRFLIIDDVVYHMGASVKDMGKSLCAVTKMNITPQEIIDNVTK